MKYFRGTTREILRIVFLMLLPILTAMADDKYVKSQEPVFPEVQPDRALVYFARTEFMRLIPLQTLRVFVDGTAAGWLPQRSYLAVQVEPGRRLVWGTDRSDPQWFEFKVGKTHLLSLVEWYGPNHVLYGTSWISGDPADVRGLVTARKLSYVTPTEEGMAKLREEVAKNYDKVRKKVPEEAAATTLPATFQTVWYRPGKRGFSFKAYDATGTLTVSKDTIEFKSDKKTIMIPVKDIQSVSLDKITSNINFADPNQWGIVRFVAGGSTQVAAFRDGHSLGTGGDTERIYLMLRSVMESAPVSSTPRSTTADVLPEEQLVVNFDQRKWRVGYETEKRGQRIKEFVLPEETVDNWTELVTVQSFPGAEKRTTAKETALGMKQQLNECPNAMWRIIQGGEDEFLYEWQTVDCPGWDNQYEVSKIVRAQTALHHIAYANRKLPIAEETRRQWTDLIAKAGFQTLGSAAQSTPAPSPPQPKTADTLPEGFVLYEGFKDQFTIAIPEVWTAYDQSQALKGVPGRFGVIFFLPSKDFKPEAAEVQVHVIVSGKETVGKGANFMSFEVLKKVDTGEVPSFFTDRGPADKGMSCSGFSEKAEKKLVKRIASDSIFGKGSKVLEPPHSDPTPVAGCKGLRIRGSAQPSGGPSWVIDVYAASDGETLYLFSLRNHAENFAKNTDLFQKAVSTAKLSAPK